MFERPFSFDGRIRRTEFGLTFVIYLVVIGMMYLLASASSAVAVVALLVYIPLLWFLWAQGAKRCHDRGNTGWFQIIPFYFLWLVFADGDYGPNEYGPNPKGLGNDENPQPSDDIILDQRIN